MEFKIEKKKNPHKDKYADDEFKIALGFAKSAMQEFEQFVKAIVLFGSTSKKRHHNPERKGQKPNDIDILVVLNDVNMVMTDEVTESYKIIAGKIIDKTSDRIHLTTLMFSNFWELVKNGDPVVINILRDGVALIDTGFFEPLQSLLYQGRIRPTWEAIYSYYQRAPQTLLNSKAHIKQAVVDIYWAVVDSAHAALMKIGEIPPSPSHIADMLDEKMAKKGMINKKHVTTMRNLYHLSKHIVKNEVQEIRGAEYDKHLRDAQDFVHSMKRIIEMK